MKRLCGLDKDCEMDDAKVLNKILPVAIRLVCYDEEFSKLKQVTVWRLFDENENNKTH